MTEPPIAHRGQRIERGPYRVRSERRWDVTLPDGTRAVLGQLVPEAASEESMRRRYVYEAERLAAIEAPRLARVLAIGPQPDPRAIESDPPWRLRELVQGLTFEAWLQGRAPVPVELAVSVVAEIAEAVHGVHAAGAVLRDLEPRTIVIDDDGAAWLTDIGLARVDILSTHTASSMLLEGSPYAAPEHLEATVVDPRADVYTLGVMLWRAVTGTLPYGDGPALLRDHYELPPLAELCSDPPDGLDQLLRQCLAESPDERPDSARIVAEVLRGGVVPSTRALARVTCQACGTPMRVGLRLCLECGKTAVQFRHVAGADAERYRGNYALFLTKAKETEAFHTALRAELDVLAEAPPERLNFAIGNKRMYSDKERAEMITLPACLFRDLAPDTAEQLKHKLKRAGFKAKLRPTHWDRRTRRRGKALQWIGGAAFVGGIGLVAAGGGWAVLAVTGGIGMIIAGSVQRGVAPGRAAVPLAQLRSSPMALPAADPLVARVGELLRRIRSEDVREQLGELALLSQRLCEHRASLDASGRDPAELDLIAEPLVPVIDLVEREADALDAIDRELAELDEGLLVRAIASSEARKEPRGKRAPLLAGLDRLRALEDRRAVRFQRLLEASSLLRQIVDLGLGVDNPRLLADNYTQMARAALGAGDSEPTG